MDVHLRHFVADAVAGICYIDGSVSIAAGLNLFWSDAKVGVFEGGVTEPVAEGIAVCGLGIVTGGDALRGQSLGAEQSDCQRAGGQKRESGSHRG